MKTCEQLLDNDAVCGKLATHSVDTGQASEYRCADCVAAAQALPENEGVEYFPLQAAN